jgi:P-type conjugative transfer protein TrbL
MDGALLDELLTAFQQAAGPMLRRLTPQLLLLLTTTFLVQTAWDLLFSAVDDRPLLPMVLRKILAYSFLFLLATNLATLLPILLDTFSRMGQSIGGLGSLSPEAVFRHGLALATTLYRGWGTEFSRMLPGIGVFPQVAFFLVAGAFALVALQILRTLIEAALSVSGLAVLLGFWGLRLTRGISDGYIRFLLEVSGRLFALLLVVAVGQNFALSWNNRLQGVQEFDPVTGFTVLLAAATFAFVAWALPNRVGRLVSHGFTFNPRPAVVVERMGVLRHG